MKNWARIGCAATIVCLIVSGCGKNVLGTYQRDGSKKTVTFTKDGKFLLSNGDSGSYTVEGKTIVMTNPMFGGAKGEISGSTLVFPEVSKNNFAGASFQGTWKKQ